MMKKTIDRYIDKFVLIAAAYMGWFAAVDIFTLNIDITTLLWLIAAPFTTYKVVFCDKAYDMFDDIYRYFLCMIGAALVVISLIEIGLYFV